MDKEPARYQEWETEDLVRAVTLEPSDYQAEALALMSAELERRNISAERMEEISAEERTGGSRIERSLEGVKGWLGLMVCVIAVGAGVSLFLAAELLRNDMNALRWLLLFGSGGLGTFGVVTTWHLLRWAPQAPRYAIAWFGAATILTWALAYWVYRRTGEWTDAPALSTTFWSGIWCTYLLASKRVKATYSAPDLDAHQVETFS